MYIYKYTRIFIHIYSYLIAAKTEGDDKRRKQRYAPEDGDPPNKTRLIQLMTELFVVQRARWLENVSGTTESGSEQYGMFAKQDLKVRGTGLENLLLEYRGTCAAGRKPPTPGKYVIGWKHGKQYRYINGSGIAGKRQPTLALVNHSERRANVKFVYDDKRVFGELIADVLEGEELLVNYGGSYSCWVNGEQECREYPVPNSI